MGFAWRAAFALSAVAVVFVAVGMTRLLEPTDDAWCGSVLNRHRTYEPAIDSECDSLLAPRRAEAAVPLGAAAASAGLAAVVARRLRSVSR